MYNEKQAHCVSMTLMFCCVTEKKIAAELLSSWDDCYDDAVCVDTAIWGIHEAVKSSQMILVESVEYK